MSALIHPQLTLKALLPLARNDPKWICPQEDVRKLVVNWYQLCQQRATSIPTKKGVLIHKVALFLEAFDVTYSTASTVVKIIKIQVYRFKTKSSEYQKWVFHLQVAGKSKYITHFVCDKLISIRSFPVFLFNGNEYVQSDVENVAVLPATFWDKWKTPNYGTGKYYRDFIYPLISSIAKLWKPQNVLDVGGGDGELAAQVLLATKPSTYHLIENNKTALDTARVRKLSVILHTYDALRGAYLSLTKTKVDLVILSGVIAYNVVDRQGACNIFRECRQTLHSGGITIITGYSPCHLFSDFEMWGFKVWNRSFTYTTNNMPLDEAYLRGELKNDYFYVLEKLPLFEIVETTIFVDGLKKCATTTELFLT